MYLFIFTLFLSFNSAHAWDHHQAIMSQLMDTKAASSRDYLKMMVVIPSEEDQKKTLETLAKELEVNAEKVPLQKAGKVSVADFIQGESIDEPDFGMDQDLPDSTDPKNDRAWMGGKTGPTSQGFRHMFFQGIEWSSPLRTLQIPFHGIGQSPERILKLHFISKKFFDEKNIFWGLRTLLWELHFIQDLHQPFHVMQVPYFKMLPWKDLFRKFVARSTQVIANYHYAYEGLVNESVHEGKLSTLVPCFELEAAPQFPEINAAMIAEVVQLSRKHAHEIGVPLHQLWDRDLKDPVMNLPEGMGALDYYSYLHANAEENNQKQDVESVNQILKTTCDLMKNLTKITFSELDQSFKSISISTGK